MIFYHIPIKYFSAAEYIEIIDRIKGKCTHLIIGELINFVEWETMLDFLPGSLYDDGRYPGAMMKEEFAEVVKACRKAKIDPMPDFRFFSHQRKSFLNLQKNGKAKAYAINDRTSAANPETFLVQNLLIDEICALLKPKIAYIGHDEAFIEGSPLLQNHKFLGRPAYVHEFKRSIEELYSKLSGMGIRMAMAGDTFIKRGQFKGVIGGANGSDKTVALLNDVPKDVIIITWHYKGITSEVIRYFTDKGFDTVGLAFDTTATYSQLKSAIEGNSKAYPGLATWSRSRGGRDYFIDEFNQYFPLKEEKKPSLWERIKKLFS